MLNLKQIPFGEIEAFNVLVEIEQGSNLKYEYDEESDQLILNFTFINLTFPFNYGFIVKTLGGDGDALDAIVLSFAPISSGSVIKCKTIGVLKSIDRGEVDDKIICVPVDDELAKRYQDITDLPQDSLDNWTKFYSEIGKQKNKSIEIVALKNKEMAILEIKNSLIK